MYGNFDFLNTKETSGLTFGEWKNKKFENDNRQI